MYRHHAIKPPTQRRIIRYRFPSDVPIANAGNLSQILACKRDALQRHHAELNKQTRFWKSFSASCATTRCLVNCNKSNTEECHVTLARAQQEELKTFEKYVYFAEWSAKHRDNVAAIKNKKE